MLNHLFYHFCIHFIQNSPYLNPLKLRIKNKAVKLIALCHRRIPFHQRNNVQAQIKRLVDADIIKKGWRSAYSMEIPEQNKAIIRELHRFQTLDEIVNGLNSAKIFRKLDLTQVIISLNWIRT